MASEVSIVNRALRLLRVEAITAMSESGATAAWARDIYPDARDALLQEYPWNFAMRRASLSASTSAPAFGFARAFPLPEAPEKCLRVWRLEGEPDIEMVWRVEGRQLLTDEAAPLQIHFIAQVTDTAVYAPLFVEALAACIAAEGAFHFTGSTSREAQLAELRRQKVGVAKQMDALEGTPEDLVANEWLGARL